MYWGCLGPLELLQFDLQLDVLVDHLAQAALEVIDFGLEEDAVVIAGVFGSLTLELTQLMEALVQGAVEGLLVALEAHEGIAAVLLEEGLGQSLCGRGVVRKRPDVQGGYILGLLPAQFLLVGFLFFFVLLLDLVSGSLGQGGEELGFGLGDPLQAPEGVGDAADEPVLQGGAGVEGIDHLLVEAVVGIGFFVGEQGL
ncbi:MAG: hypothetical protein QUS33_10255, partial [Dehalococcoidia bacterium]|nr:hypothetical protein [Dehalococcoidia bacterium]